MPNPLPFRRKPGRSGSHRAGKGLHKPVVLIVDGDLGFTFWLGGIVVQAGCDCVPALNSRQAVSFVKKLKVEIDLLIVNEDLAGIPEMIQTIARMQHAFQIASSRAPISRHDLTSRVAEPVLRRRWLHKVRKSLGMVQAINSK